MQRRCERCEALIVFEPSGMICDGEIAEHIFIPGRLRFEDDNRVPSSNCAPFSSMLLVWKPENINNIQINIL